MEQVLYGYDFYNSIGKPKFICAPMVDQSELAFRQLTRNHGVQLAYSPMINSKILIMDKNYKNDQFSTNETDKPLFIQLCGNDPEIIVQAAKMLEDQCDAIDINLGCPQGIARKGNYGAFLLEKPDIILSMVRELRKNLKVPVTCKIRILKDRNQTIELAKSIQEAGCSILTVHGRTKEQNKDFVGQCDWEIIKKIKETLTIPIFANGGIYNWNDVQRCLEFTQVDGVMSSEALLENPALFSGEIKDLDDLALEYMDLALIHKAKLSEIKGHLFKLLHKGLQVHIDLRSKLAQARTYDEHLIVAKEMKERRKEEDAINKFGWYHRYQGFKKQIKEEKQEQVIEQIVQQQEI